MLFGMHFGGLDFLIRNLEMDFFGIPPLKVLRLCQRVLSVACVVWER